MPGLESSDVSGSVVPVQGEVCKYCEGAGAEIVYNMKTKQKEVRDCMQCDGLGFPPRQAEALEEAQEQVREAQQRVREAAEAQQAVDRREVLADPEE